MDTKNVSDDKYYVDQVKQLKEAAEAAALRKGESVTDHPPLDYMIFMFLYNLQSNSEKETSDPYKLVMTQVPASYPPCARSLHDLKPIAISAMKFETHHRGSKVMLRIRTPPDRINAGQAIVEDEEGTGVLLQMYHLPEESVVPAQHIIYLGRICILKEPFFKVTVAGAYSLRVDHPSDLVWMAPDDEAIPDGWRPTDPISNDSFRARMEGNKAISANAWAEAERLYSSAINTARTIEESRLAHQNRSFANLCLGHYENALSDALKSIADDKPRESEKARYREARALYELGRYQECERKLVVLAQDFPDNESVKAELVRAQARVREQQTGEFPFRHMYTEAAVGIPVLDRASFTGPVEIRPSPGRGRGLFTKSAVKAGDLLICEKAFAYCFAGDTQPERREKIKVLVDNESKSITIGTQAQLISQIVQKLLHNPESSKKFLDLHHGKYKAVSADEVDGRPVVDSFLVTKIILANCFGSPRTTRDVFRSLVLNIDGKKAENSHETSGVWIMASYLNHSCVGNCCRSFIGDMQIIRATRDIPADTELVFPYQADQRLASHDETQKKLRNWGFRCDCALCLEKKATTKGTWDKRKALLGQLKYLIERNRDKGVPINAKLAFEVLDKFEATHTTPARTYPSAASPSSDSGVDLTLAQITPRPDLWDACFGLGEFLLKKGRNAEAVEATIKGFEALGFVIIATPPLGKASGDGGKKKKNKNKFRNKKEYRKNSGNNISGTSTSNAGAGADQLVVKSWGMVVNSVVIAFRTLYRAYKPTAPDLANRAREYTATAYGLLVGEKETVFDEIPELREVSE
ncbi:SET domain-containing protein [Apiospora arundinis]